MIVNWSEAPAEMLELAAVKLKLVAVAGLTVTDIELLVKTPSVALMEGLSTLYKVISPPVVLTPFVKVMASLLLKLTAEPVLLVTVG